MLYLDTSCLLKLFLSEPESDAVRRSIAGEAQVVVSSLAELEGLVAAIGKMPHAAGRHVVPGLLVDVVGHGQHLQSAAIQRRQALEGTGQALVER